MNFIQNQEHVDTNVTGSHEQFWVFSQVSQWGQPWPYSDETYLNKVRQIVIQVRSIGIKNNHPARMVHIAQMLIWRYYLKVHDEDTSIIEPALLSAAQFLEIQKSHESQMHQNQDPSKKSSEFMQQIKLLKSLDLNIKINHPSEYLSHFVTSQFGVRQYQLAECIISDSFLSPCCLLHKPVTIAEGAAIMAAGMTDLPDAAIPRTVQSISFIKDMKFFYRQSSSVQPGGM